MHISIFGASVTQQKTGYANCYKTMNTNDDVSVYGHGGLQIHNGGLIFLENALKYNPDLIIFDWFTPGYTDFTYDHIKLILEELIRFCIAKKTKMLFLYLPYVEETPDTIQKRENYYKITKNILDMYNIMWLDLSYLDNESYRYDMVHTTEEGSKKYAEALYNKMKNLDIKLCTEDIPKNLYSNIKNFNISKDFKSCKIESNGSILILGLHMKIGPYSKQIEYIVDNGSTQYYNIWDKWCYYERESVHFTYTHFDKQIEFKTKESDDIDRSEAKLQCDWEKEDAMLKFLEIYYVSNDGSIVSIEY